MSLTQEFLSSIPTSYATVSIGTQKTPLPEKLGAIAGAGWQGIELGFPDLLSFASQNLGRDVGPQEFDLLCNSGKEVKRLCGELGLKIVMLQPFSNFEGWKPESEERKDAFRRAKGWIRIMEAIGCNMLQVGSSDSPAITTARDSIVSDLKKLADLLSPHGFRLAYENWCWSSHAPDWRDAWDIVKEIDRPNVGLCLDTFQTAGGEWADPTTESGLIEDRGSREEMEKVFQRSLHDLSVTIPADKIYILQISDAYKTRVQSTPDDSGLRPRGQWSSCLRPMPFDGGYLPVVEVAKAVLKTGFRGWFSMEIFDGGPAGDDQDWKDMPGFAKKAMQSHERLLKECATS
ncbi:MAG: hypothetical protein Q9217_003531 [Psora testacea]